MARPIKTGLDYFSFDVDFFENRKVKKVMRACGPASGTVLSCLLCNIYRWKGYYILWDEELPFDIADQVGVSEGLVTETLTKAIQTEFFHKGKYDEHKILTSVEIQKRFLSMTAKRTDVVIDDNYLVIDGRNPVNGGNNSITGGDNPQSKVKESKVKESKAVGGTQHASLFSNAEKIILENPIELEKICCAAPKNFTMDDVKLALQKYHLFLDEKGRYPMTKQQMYSGFKRWLLNEKNFNNAGKQSANRQGGVYKPVVAEGVTTSGKF